MDSSFIRAGNIPERDLESSQVVLVKFARRDDAVAATRRLGDVVCLYPMTRPRASRDQRPTPASAMRVLGATADHRGTISAHTRLARNRHVTRRVIAMRPSSSGGRWRRDNSCQATSAHRRGTFASSIRVASHIPYAVCQECRSWYAMRHEPGDGTPSHPSRPGHDRKRLRSHRSAGSVGERGIARE